MKDRALTPCDDFNTDKTAVAQVVRQMDHAAYQSPIRTVPLALKYVGLAPTDGGRATKEDTSAPSSSSAGGAMLRGRTLECLSRLQLHTPVLNSVCIN